MRIPKITIARLGSIVTLGLIACPMLSGQWMRIFQAPFTGNHGATFEITGLAQSPDGGYMAAIQKDGDAWFVKLRANGAFEWQNWLGVDIPRGLAAAADGYLIHTDSAIIKIDLGGTPLWMRSLGQLGYIRAVCTSQDGGFVVVGRTDSPEPDAFAVKVGPSGAIDWAWAYGGELADTAEAVSQTADWGYILAGSCTSLTPGNGKDLWILKLSGSGGLEWQKNYGGPDDESGRSVRQTPDGEYILGGASSPLSSRSWVLKIGASGDVAWRRIIKDLNSSCLVTVAAGGDLIVASGGSILRLDSGGASLWQKDVVLADYYGSSVLQAFEAADGSVVAFGRTPYTPSSTYGLAARLASDGRLTPCDSLREGTHTIQEAAIQAFDSHIIPRGLAPVMIESIPESRPIKGSSILLCPSPGDAVQLSLSPSRLNYACALGRPSTPAQSFVIRNSGTGMFQWTIEGIPGWLHFSRTAGAGESLVTLTADPAGISPGLYTAQVMVNSPEAEINPLFLQVDLSIIPAGTTIPPFGSFDTPISGSTGSGSVPVTGWALDDIGAASVTIWRRPVAGESPADGWIYIGDAVFVDGARPDIEALYPGWPLSSRGGWGYLLLTNMFPNQGNGFFTLAAVAVDMEGHQSLLGEKTFYCDNAHSARPFGTIDTPAQGGIVATNPFVNFGWVLTPLPSTIPKDGSTISVWVDSVQVGNLGAAPNAYDKFRSDVSGIFAGLNNSNGPVGFFYLDTSKYRAGTHSIFWIATDDNGNADGIGSRFFILANGGSSAPSAEPIRGPSFSSAVPDRKPHMLRTGFSPKDRPLEIRPDKDGRMNFDIHPLERIELALGEIQGSPKSGMNAARFHGYLNFDGELRPLPIGSTLDPETGTFAWQPGPGFLGSYNLVFIRTEATGKSFTTQFKLTIRPH